MWQGVCFQYFIIESILKPPPHPAGVSLIKGIILNVLNVLDSVSDGWEQLYLQHHTDLPLLHWRQLYPAVESGIIAADKISAVLSWKTYIIKVNDTDYSDDLTKWVFMVWSRLWQRSVLIGWSSLNKASTKRTTATLHASIWCKHFIRKSTPTHDDFQQTFHSH